MPAYSQGRVQTCSLGQRGGNTIGSVKRDRQEIFIVCPGLMVLMDNDAIF